MRILMSSYAFPPSVGGLEEVSEILAHQFAELGHEVRVLTMTPSPGPDRYPFPVIRQPSAMDLVRSIHWCEVYLQQNISFRLAWPLLAVRRPWVVAMHAPPFTGRGRPAYKNLLKSWSLRFARLIACSSAVAKGLRNAATVIANPYRSDVFRLLAQETRSHDLIFLGRLVSDKGVSVLLDAVAALRARGIRPRTLIIGSGPEEAALRAQVSSLELTEQILFAGMLRGEELARRLNQSGIMVVPSIWDEPFGVVALEGIACGCIVVASAAGGLPEAVGPCGLTFPKGDATALADRLSELLGDANRIAHLRSGAETHLRRHQPRTVAEAYLAVLTDARKA